MNRFLFKPIDIATLVLFRIVAGCLLAFEQINQLLSGDFNNYLEPQFHFSYMFFPWIKPLPPQGMYLLIGITIAAGFFVAAGLFYRASATVLFIGYSLLFLMEETEYVNHFYLYCLLCFILILVPAHRAFSMDVVRKPWLKRAYTPAWAVYILLFQISLVYFYAGVAKLHPDWLEARPLQIWMAAKASRAVIGPMLAHPFTPWLMSYAGVAVDLLFAPLLLFRRTRIIGLALAVIFHSSNALIFGLATFPWFSLLLTSMYFSPSWPRRLPVLRRHLPAFNPESITFNQQKVAYSKVLSSFLILYAATQILVPLRHFLYPGNVNWTEEGHKFAWHMMLRSKSGS
ncbi:MAG: HTTM domain-containing protein, partial [Hymenobacteraceae bacterium]|nr:HTTM domain-containing protein [Hymenobacteraceae bacterium]